MTNTAHDDTDSTNAWDAIDPPATKEQRQACYRLGLSRSYVRTLTTSTASIAIDHMLAMRRDIGRQRNG